MKTAVLGQWTEQRIKAYETYVGCAFGGHRSDIDWWCFEFKSDDDSAVGTRAAKDAEFLSYSDNLLQWLIDNFQDYEHAYGFEDHHYEAYKRVATCHPLLDSKYYKEKSEVKYEIQLRLYKDSSAALFKLTHL